MNSAQNGGEVQEAAARCMITSRLLILESKRLMLSSLHRRLKLAGSKGEMAQRLEYFRAETQRAQQAYNSSVAKFGSPDSNEFWLVAYGRLISQGGNLVSKLQLAAPSLSPTDQMEVATDVDGLEMIIEGWSRSMRRSMLPVSA